MSRIVRRAPLRELVVGSQMDQLIGNLMRESSVWQGHGDKGYMRLALDVREDDHGYNVKASLPGIDPENLDISFSENKLTIQGKVQAESVDENAKWHLRERHSGEFMRSITLPAAVDADAIQAAYENGVLTLALPKAEDVKPRKIAVRATGDGAVAA